MQTAVIGAVEYSISDKEENVIEARYLSTGSMAQMPGKICRGRAVGDTSNGFAGEYVIQYFGVQDELVGEFDWIIEATGEGYVLTWKNRPANARIAAAAGEVVFNGFGFPNSEKSIVVAYWMSEPTSKAMIERAMQAAQQ
jgi:hypothetical protein